MPVKTYPFEGEQRTVAEINRMVPRLSDATIRKHIKAGRCTVMAMMSFDPRAVSNAAIRRAYVARGKPSILSGGKKKKLEAV